MTPTVLDIDLMQTAASQAASALRSLANEDRLMLLCSLSQGEKSVGELSVSLNIVQPTLSQQLTVLRNEQLVNTRREGKRIYYSIADDNVLQILTTLYQLYCPKK